MWLLGPKTASGNHVHQQLRVKVGKLVLEILFRKREKLIRFWFLSHMRETKTHTSLRADPGFLERVSYV